MVRRIGDIALGALFLAAFLLVAAPPILALVAIWTSSGTAADHFACSAIVGFFTVFYVAILALLADSL